MFASAPSQIATCVANFVPPFPSFPSTSNAVQFLPFYVGERLHIISHCDNWCVGHLESDPNQIGIFPSNFIEPIDETLPDEDINRRTSSSTFYTAEESKQLLSEITETLKAWWKFLKVGYSRGIQDFEFSYYEELIKDLMIIRKKILSGNVPTEELRELRHESARKIDLGNHKMGLGMHIRDEASRILRIDKLSVVEAYREHERAYAKITSDNSIEVPQTSALIITLNQADFKLEYNCELTLLLWDNEVKKPLTEPIVFNWGKKSNKFSHHHLNGMFLGLSDQELMKDSLELAASLTIVAPVDIALAAASGKPLKINTDNILCRQPLAEAKIKLADKLRDIADKEKRELRLSFNALLPIEKYQSNRKSEIYIEFSIQRLTGPSTDEIRMRHPEIFTPKPVSILRLHLPSAKEIIEEGRNEIYLKLGAADLHGGKHSDKNIEAFLKVYDDEGNPQTGCFPTITPDGRIDASFYRSRVFCLNDRPMFEEMIKISLPSGPTRDLHLRILFYHRRTFDKAEKGPFALSYIRLIHKGVLEKPTIDELLIYKLEKYEERKNYSGYLLLCPTKLDLKNFQKPRAEASSYILNEKNSLTFETTVISCKHTTDFRLRSILSHKEKNHDAISFVNSLIHSDDVIDEIIKFLPDFMDSLFQILSFDPEANKRIIFNALVHIIRICEDPKYHSYLDDYLIHFHAANAFKPLLSVLIDYMDISPSLDGTRDPLLPVLKALGYLTKIIIKSKECHHRMFHGSWADISEDFVRFFDKIKGLIQDERKRMVCQNAAVKYLPTMFSPLIESGTFDLVNFAKFCIDLLDGFSKNIIIREKITFLSEIIATDLFLSPDCLKILLPRFLEEVIIQMRPYSAGYRRSDFESETYLETVELGAKVLSDIVERLFPFSQIKSVYQTGVEDQLQLIVTKTVRIINQTEIIILPKDPVRIRPVHALNLALLNKFSTTIFINFLGALPYSSDRKDVLSEMLHMFRDLLEQCPFPIEWYQMRYLQFKMFMKHIRFIKAYILRYFSIEESDLSIWQIFFKTVSVIAQKIIPNKDTSIYNTENRLMRKSAALIIRSMWLSLNPIHKPLIIDKVLGDILLVTLVDDFEIREAMIPVFYDMLLVERYDNHSFVDEFIMHLDPLIDKGLGNSIFREQLRTGFNKCCSKDDYIQLEFVERIDRLLGLLLNLRQVRNDADCVESGKFCLVQLVNFYASINQNELKVHHLHNLYAAHLESGSDVEAALTLKRFAELLEWSSASIPSYISKRQYDRGCVTQAALRENLFIEMGTLFDKGEHLEKAIEVLKELIPVYEGTLCDYGKLADLHRRIGTLYDKINKDMRVESYYFLVAFYGKGFPEYLANKKFVFRGEKLEMLAQFKEKILGKYYGAQFIESVDNRDDLATAEGKYIQIIPVTPVNSKCMKNPNANALVRWYYKYHDVYEFEHLRSERRDDTKWTKIEANDATRLWIRRKIINISYSLPGILNFAPVENSYDRDPENPVEVAIQEIEKVNENLRETAEMVAAGFNQCLVRLGGWIRGILQANVGGGINSYKSFFTKEIKSEATPTELKAINRLSRLLLHHVTIIEYCLCIHASKPQLVNENFHAALVDLFLDYRRNIEKQFGLAPSMLHSADSIHLPASGALTSTGISTSSGNFTTHASNSSLSLDESNDKQQSVLLRAVPGAATLLRTTMSRSKLPTPNKKSTGVSISMDFENSAQMLQTLRELASRDVLASPEPIDDIIGDFQNNSSSPRPPPPLPPRNSNFHGPVISN